jgi:ribonuclease HII
LLAGVDEAGRGPLAGPVAVAAVILDPARPIDGLDDSKRLSAARREVLYRLISEHALAHCVVFVDAAEIDQVNILQATLRGMSRALRGLATGVEFALVDGNRLPRDLPCPARAIVGGDALEPCISAASILAKVVRDHHMLELDRHHPGYGFNRHMGYPTPEHLEALSRLGPCPEHRRSFAPVRRLLSV